MEKYYDRFLYYFKQISKIPRNSKHEKYIADYIVAFAKWKKLPYYCDEFNNVLITKKGNTKSTDTIILQGHLDMVCIKDLGVQHDFSKDAINLIISNKTIKANKTTLGADNGVAIAIMLTILESDLNHPNLECLFTTDEEEGMSGIKNFDMKQLKGKYCINLDNEIENEVIIGSAGGVTGIFYQLNNKLMKNNLPAYEIEISNLHGGHSGVEINKGYWNSNLLIAKILENISSNGKVYISEFIGGQKDNAISNHSRCIFHTDNTNIQKYIYNYFQNLPFSKEEQDYQLNLKLVNNTISYNMEDSSNIIRLLTGLKQNVIYKFDDHTPSTSANIGMVNITNLNNEIHLLLRSAKRKEFKQIMHSNKTFAKECNYKCLYKDIYPLWEKNSNSSLLNKYKAAYKFKTGKDIKENIIHAGLECCVIKEKIPNMEIISIGPNIRNVHTVKEELEIFSTKKHFVYFNLFIKGVVIW